MVVAKVSSLFGRTLRVALVVMAVLCWLSLDAMAQTTAPKPVPPATPSGTGSAGGGASAPTPNHGKELDLPLSPPVDGLNEDREEEDDDDFNEDDTTKLYDEDVPINEDSIIYVIDISGSMGWGTQSYTGLDGNTTSGTRLDRAKVELVRSIAALTDDFEFNVVAFDCSTTRWASSKQKATPENKASAQSWVMALQDQGATGTGPATALGLEDKENKTVVLLSDGSPNCGASGTSGHLSMIQSANTQGAVIHTFGIGATGQFEQFLRDIASAAGGQYFPVN